jgi:hypothetical protein
MVNFLRKHEAFTPLLTRLTKNYWLQLTDEEKSHSVRLHQSKFLIPTSREAFDFSEDAFTRLATRLCFEMLTPDDVNALKAHGAPILPDNTLSLDDAAWVREPYAKAVLYRLVKYRKDEQDAQSERMKTASARIEKPFKRVHLVEDEMSAEPIATRINQAEITVHIAQKHETSKHVMQANIVQANIAQPLKRIELESDDAPCEIINSEKSSERRWIEEMKENVLSLFGILTKMRAFAE